MFSVVIPLYNKAHTIERTLFSVLQQTYKSFEVIIVNDGSTDNGIEVINKFTSDHRIRIIEQENSGVSAARNTGVAESIYDYIAFLDGDDEWMPGFLEKIKYAIELFPEAGLYGTPSWHRNFVTGEGSDSTLSRYRRKIQIVEYFENPATMPHTSAMVVKKEAFNLISLKNEGFPLGMKCCEDWSCFFRIALRFQFIYIGFPLGIRNNNVKGQITGLSADERFNFLCHVVDFYNITFDYWKESEVRNTIFLINLRYDLRHRFLCALKEKDYKTINFICKNISTDILEKFPNFEMNFVKNKHFIQLSKLYIYFTKIIWRMHQFPIVGNK